MGAAPPPPLISGVLAEPESVEPTIDRTPTEDTQPLLSEVATETHSTEAEPIANEPDQSSDIIKELRAAVSAQQDEIWSLYRRLHIELPPERRSELIVELLHDERVPHQRLGFELADRDLSASVALDGGVGEAGKALISSTSPLIRALSARLITRMGLPDAMIVLTDALRIEQSPIAAEPMLLGIARWPNAEATQSVLSWMSREDAPLVAGFRAAWSLETAKLWNPDEDYPELLIALHNALPRELREDGMRLLARLGSSADLRKLVDLMLDEDPAIVRWAASALVETPRAVEVLEQSAQNNEVFFQAAAESLVQHRSTPDGLRRLNALPQSDKLIKHEYLLRMGQSIPRDQLGEAVKLAELDPQTKVEILSRLIGTEEAHNARSAKGVLQLAQLHLDSGRPNRALEALLSIRDTKLDLPDVPKHDQIRTQSLLLLGRVEEAARISVSFSVWMGVIDQIQDPMLRSRLAKALLSESADILSDEQTRSLEVLVNETKRPIDMDPANTTDRDPEE